MIIYRKLIANYNSLKSITPTVNQEVYLYDTKTNQEKLIWKSDRVTPYSVIGIKRTWMGYKDREHAEGWYPYTLYPNGSSEIDITEEEAFEIML